MKKGHAHDICLLVAAVAACLAVFEIILALFWPHKIEIYQLHEQYHPVMGWVNKPHMDGKIKLIRSSGAYFTRRHNGNGLRSTREIVYDRPAGMKRILLIGDSFFWGYGVNDDEVISEVLQRRAGQNVEIINGAVSGYGTDQELLWLAEEGLKYRPDLVILGTFPANDLDEISSSVMYDYPKPFFALEGGKLTARNIPVPDTRETRRKGFEEPDSLFGKLKKILRHNSHAYQFIVGRLNSVPALRKFFLSTGLADEFTKDLPGIPAYQLKPEKAPELYRALIRQVMNVSAESGAAFLLIHIPQKEQDMQGRPGYAGVSRQNYEWNSKMSSNLRDFSERNGIPLLDLLPVVRSHQAQGELLYTPNKYDHHWTPKGHEVMADAIVDWLRGEGWIR